MFSARFLFYLTPTHNSAHARKMYLLVMVKNKLFVLGFVLLIIRKMNKMMWRLNNPETKKEHNFCRERKKKEEDVSVGEKVRTEHRISFVYKCESMCRHFFSHHRRPLMFVCIMTLNNVTSILIFFSFKFIISKS